MTPAAAWAFLAENWLVIAIALAVIAVYALVRFSRREQGHADDDQHRCRCCLCDKAGIYRVPIVGIASTGVGWIDDRRERSRGFEGIAPRYRIVPDFSDPRRLCTLHHREHRARILTQIDDARAQCRKLNATLWTRLNEITLDREAPVPLTQAITRAPIDSSIDLGPMELG